MTVTTYSFDRRRAARLAMAIFCCVGGAMVAEAQPATITNKYNDELLKMSPPDQAAKLASYLGFFCVGTKPFYMGVTKAGPSAGYAYWSLECAGALSYAIQIAPSGKGEALDCNELKANGEGRECYKTF
jgi:hypothetical protein